MLIFTWVIGPPPGGNLNTRVYKGKSNHCEYSILTKLRISRSINYMIIFLSEVKWWWAWPDVILPLPKKPCQFYFNSIDCTTPSAPNMKYSLLSVLSKWADSQFGFWSISHFEQFQIQSNFWIISPNGLSNDNSWRRYIFCQNGLIPNLDFGPFQIQSNFWIISPNGLSNENSRRRYLFCWNGLIPKSTFRQIQIQSEFWIISPNGIANEDSRRR